MENLKKEQIEQFINDLNECYGCDPMYYGVDANFLAESLVEMDWRKQEWISVEDRLPEEDGTYITYTNAKGKDKGVIVQSLRTRNIRGNTIRRWEWQTRISPWIVTHWMPLPEPPKMKGGE